MNGKRLVFGILGLHNGSMVMRDHETSSLWSCYMGLCIEGPMRGKALHRIPAFLCQLGEWLEEHPDSEVFNWIEHPLHADPRHGHGSWFHFNGRGPHPHALQTMVAGHFDARRAEFELVLGVIHGGSPTAFPLAELHRSGCLIETTIANDPIVAWARSPASAWMGAYSRALDGKILEFERVGHRFRERSTGSVFTAEGRALDGPLAGKSLTPLDFVTVRWSAWSGFHPTTGVYRGTADTSHATIARDGMEHVLERLERAGLELVVEREILQGSLPPAATRGLRVRVQGDPFLLFAFGDSGDASDYAASSVLLPRDLYSSFFPGEPADEHRRHAIVTGSHVLESDPDVQYGDHESLRRLPDDLIQWPRLENDPRFLHALGVEPATTPPVTGKFAALFSALQTAGYGVRRIKPMLRQWLRPAAVDGYSAEIQGDRFLIYRFGDEQHAAAYARERHHTIQAGTFVLRSDPPGQYYVTTEQTMDRPVDKIPWSTLLADDLFCGTLRTVRF